jgi:ribonuclease HI
METILPTRKRPGYDPSVTTRICGQKEDAIELALDLETSRRVRVYTDGSAINGQVGAAAVLFIGEREKKVVHYHLGTTDEHTVYEAEIVALTLGLEALRQLNRDLPDPYVGLDNQAAIKALDNQNPHPSHYLLDHAHNLAQQIHAKQYNRTHATERRDAYIQGIPWVPETNNSTSLEIHWTPGHADIHGNERADEEANTAAEGTTSLRKHLPAYLRHQPLPLSISATRQKLNSQLKDKWREEWHKSPRYSRAKRSFAAYPSAAFFKLTQGLNRRQSSLLIQLRTQHIALNHHLHRINKANSPDCQHCGSDTPETIQHFLLECPKYRYERQVLINKLGRDANSISYLTTVKKAVRPLLTFIHATKRLEKTFGSVLPGNGH